MRLFHLCRVYGLRVCGKYYIACIFSETGTLTSPALSTCSRRERRKMWESDNKIKHRPERDNLSHKISFLEGFKMYNSGSGEGLYVETAVKI